MNTSQQFNITEGENGRLLVELQGKFDEPDARAFENELKQTLEGKSQSSTEVLFDLRKMSQCTILARAVLVRVQGYLAEKARRTAYLDDRPRFRGLALWIVHVSEDGNAKAVSIPTAAERWFRSSADRHIELRELTRSSIELARRGRAGDK